MNTATTLITPIGLEEIIAMFGDVRAYIQRDGSLDPRWEEDFLALVTVPFPLPLAWDPAKAIRQFRCHKRLGPGFGEVFARIVERGLESEITSFGGCYSFRPQRGASKLSAHCWGIAIDLNPQTNVMGTAGTMNRGVVEAFTDFGFEWGGSWTARRDPMHFQFCQEY
jgi:hypothetical protein